MDKEDIYEIYDAVIDTESRMDLVVKHIREIVERHGRGEVLNIHILLDEIEELAGVSRFEGPQNSGKIFRAIVKDYQKNVRERMMDKRNEDDQEKEVTPCVG